MCDSVPIFVGVLVYSLCRVCILLPLTLNGMYTFAFNP